MKPKEGPSRREFPRVVLQQGERPLSKLMGSKVLWPSGEEGEIHDLSYTGVAVVRESGANFQPGQVVNFHFLFPGQEAIEAQGEVVRQSERLVALRLDGLSTQARLGIDKYLHEKIIGIHVRRIDPRYFARPDGPTHWFHGPNNTNIFLWYEHMALKRALVETGNQFLEWQDYVFNEGKAKELLDGEEDQYSPSYMQSQPHAVSEGYTPFMARVLDLLTQIEDTEKVFEPLIHSLMDRKR